MSVTQREKEKLLMIVILLSLRNAYKYILLMSKNEYLIQPNEFSQSIVLEYN